MLSLSAVALSFAPAPLRNGKPGHPANDRQTLFGAKPAKRHAFEAFENVRPFADFLTLGREVQVFLWYTRYSV